MRADPVYVLKAQFFRVLGHPVRIRILELLTRHDEMTVGELQAGLNLDSGGTSQHLSALRQLGVLDSRRAGTNVHYRIRDPIVVRAAAGRAAGDHLRPDRFDDRARHPRRRRVARGAAAGLRRRVACRS